MEYPFYEGEGAFRDFLISQKRGRFRFNFSLLKRMDWENRGCSKKGAYHILWGRGIFIKWGKYFKSLVSFCTTITHLRATTNQSICTANQMTGFYIMGKIHLKKNNQLRRISLHAHKWIKKIIWVWIPSLLNTFLKCTKYMGQNIQEWTT